MPQEQIELAVDLLSLEIYQINNFRDDTELWLNKNGELSPDCDYSPKTLREALGVIKKKYKVLQKIHCHQGCTHFKCELLVK